MAAPRLLARYWWCAASRNPIAPQRWVEEIAALLPDGRLAVLPEAAHAINYSAPVRLAALIQGLIEETGDI